MRDTPGVVSVAQHVERVQVIGGEAVFQLVSGAADAPHDDVTGGLRERRVEAFARDPGPDHVESGCGEQRPELRRGRTAGQAGAHGREPLGLGPVEPVGKSRFTDVEVVGQDPHRFGDLGDGEQPGRFEPAAKHTERAGLVADVVE